MASNATIDRFRGSGPPCQSTGSSRLRLTAGPDAGVRESPRSASCPALPAQCPLKRAVSRFSLHFPDTPKRTMGPKNARAKNLGYALASGTGGPPWGGPTSPEPPQTPHAPSRLNPRGTSDGACSTCQKFTQLSARGIRTLVQFRLAMGGGIRRTSVIVPSNHAVANERTRAIAESPGNWLCCASSATSKPETLECVRYVIRFSAFPEDGFDAEFRP